MKSFILSLLFLVLLSIAHTQECASTQFLKEGTKWEMSNYDKKGKLTGKTKYETISEKSTDEGYLWELKLEGFDKKGEESIPETTTTIKCEGGVFKMDMSDFIPPESIESMKEMEVEMKSTNLNFPTQLSTDTQLENGTIEMTAYSSGIKIMSMEMTIKDRKIEGIERVETEAGSFECLKISQITVMDMGIITRELKATNWFLPGFGVVKSESYKSNGKSSGYSILSSMTLP